MNCDKFFYFKNQLKQYVYFVNKWWGYQFFFEGVLKEFFYVCIRIMYFVYE